jgi:hypothetical protein
VSTLVSNAAAVNAATTDETVARTERKLQAIRNELSRRNETASTVMLNPLDDLLAELELLASSALMDEIKIDAMPAALVRFARKFEELSAALAGGLPLPREWQARRKP